MAQANIVDKVNELVTNKDMSVAEACDKAGVKVWKYYTEKKKLEGTNEDRVVSKKKKKAKKKVSRKKAALAPQFKEITLPKMTSTKTLIIITEDSEAVANIVASFGR